jgi:exodeoxyribonuclease VII large subunit
MTVTELTRQIKLTLELGFQEVTVQGELSNSHLHTSGHFYFTLKDAGAQISGVMWRSRVALLPLRPDDGMKVTVTGRLTVYEPRGQYQIDAVTLKPAGAGELQIAFDRLKAKLEQDGLFEQSRKREIPRFPSRIGIVTSATGAALQDMLSIIERRYPCVEVVPRGAQVQGIGAAEDIAAGIDELNALGGVDVIIAGRGGGSIEDLWAFNEEVVARAIARSTAPVISAVGHEVDFTIADYVADLRAPTPSAAAELAVPLRGAILEDMGKTCYTMHQRMMTMLEERRERIIRLLTGYAFTRPADLLHQYSQRLDDLQSSASLQISHALQLANARQASGHLRLLALDPRLPLQRGFALVRLDGRVISSAASLKQGDGVEMEFRDGSVRSTID